MSRFLGNILLCLALYFAFVFIRSYFRHKNDPDVVDASNLHMTVGRFRKYKELFKVTDKILYGPGTDVEQFCNAMSKFRKSEYNEKEYKRFIFYMIDKWDSKMDKKDLKYWTKHLDEIVDAGDLEQDQFEAGYDEGESKA